jgi:hypothetical protein
LYPSSGAQLQRTAIGFVWFGVFIPLEQVLVWDSFTVKHVQLQIRDVSSVVRKTPGHKRIQRQGTARIPPSGAEASPKRRKFKIFQIENLSKSNICD